MADSVDGIDMVSEGRSAPGRAVPNGSTKPAISGIDNRSKASASDVVLDAIKRGG